MTEEKKPSTLAMFLAKKSNPTASTGTPAQPDSASIKAEPTVSADVVQPSVSESVKVEESIVQIEASVVGSTEDAPAQPPSPAPVRKSPLASILSTPKPEKVNTIPKPEKFQAMALQELSQLDVENMPVVDERQTFLYELNELDRLMADEHGKDKPITMFNLDDIRGVIKRIMIDWKKNPDYDDLVLGDHVHHIMRFMWDTQERAIEANGEKAIKADKAVSRSNKRAKMAAAIADMDFTDIGF